MIRNRVSTIKIQFFSFIVLVVFFVFKSNHLPPQIPLYYSKTEGEEQIVDSFMIFLLPIVSFLFVFLNNYFLNKYFSENKFLQSIFYYINLFIIFLTSFIFITILLLIT
jgi:hypothetical protein